MIARDQEAVALHEKRRGQEWGAQHVYHVLGKKVRIQSNCAAFAAQVGRLLRTFPRNTANGQEADVTFSFILSRPGEQANGQTKHLFYHNDSFVKQASSQWRLFRLLEWRLRVFLVQTITTNHLFHAGAVSKNNIGVLLPGRSKDGKSSLTMALLLNGYQYYSDELAVIDPNDCTLQPFAKPLSLRELSLFPELTEHELYKLGQEQSPTVEGASNKLKSLWFIHPEDARPGSIGQPVPLRLVIFPQYDPKAAPGIRPLPPNQAMRRLVGRSFNFPLNGLHFLARLARELPCYLLTSNDLKVTTELVDGVVERLSAAF